MPEKVITYDDLMQTDDEAIAHHCQQLMDEEETQRRYGHYPEAQGR